MNEQIFVLNSQKKNTNHILHLILSFVTFGFWLIVWALIAMSNSNHNNRIQSEIKGLMSYKLQGQDDRQAYLSVQKDKDASSLLKTRLLFGAITVLIVLAYIGSHS
jgi:hypothetical protein